MMNRRLSQMNYVVMKFNIIKQVLFSLLMIANASAVFAAKMTVKAPNIVTVGEKFQIAFQVDAATDALAFSIPPSMGDFQIIAGPVASFSSSSINGQSTSYTTFTYYVQAMKEGTVTIGQAEVKVKGSAVRSENISIEVVKSAAGAAGGQNAQSAQGSQAGGQVQQPAAGRTPASGQGRVGDGDLFLRIELNRSSLYKGEPLVASIALYTKVAVTQFSNFKAPQLTGFYSQDLEVPANENNLHRVTYNGTVYNMAVVKRSLLFPQRSGIIRIDPAEANISVQLPRAVRAQSMFDDFFAMPYEIVEKHVKSAAVEVTVKDLPQGAPSSFKGAVGNFTVKSSVDRTETTANQALSYALTVSGSGNLKLVQEPSITFPADFDKYEPKLTENVRSTNQGSTGSKKFEYALIPRSAGSFEIPGTEFSYFDPAKNSYQTLRTESINLNIEKDPQGFSQAASSASPSNVNQQDIRRLGTDILFIKTSPLILQAHDSVFFSSTAFWICIVSMIALFLLIYFALARREKTRKNTALMRNKKAVKIAKRRLKKSAMILKAGDKNGFYEELAHAVWGYLSDKFNMPSASLSRDNVQETLAKKGVAEENISLLLKVIDDCEYARYAPGNEQANMENVYREAITAISKLESSF